MYRRHSFPALFLAIFVYLLVRAESPPNIYKWIAENSHICLSLRNDGSIQYNYFTEEAGVTCTLCPESLPNKIPSNACGLEASANDRGGILGCYPVPELCIAEMEIRYAEFFKRRKLEGAPTTVSENEVLSIGTEDFEESNDPTEYINIDIGNIFTTFKPEQNFLFTAENNYENFNTGSESSTTETSFDLTSFTPSVEENEIESARTPLFSESNDPIFPFEVNNDLFEEMVNNPQSLQITEIEAKNSPQITYSFESSNSYPYEFTFTTSTPEVTTDFFQKSDISMTNNGGSTFLRAFTTDLPQKLIILPRKQSFIDISLPTSKPNRLIFEKLTTKQHTYDNEILDELASYGVEEDAYTPYQFTSNDFSGYDQFYNFTQLKPANTIYRTTITSPSDDVEDEYTSFKVLGSSMIGEPIKSDVFSRRDKLRSVIKQISNKNHRKICKDEHQLCCYWALLKECDLNPEWMRVHCARTCGACNCGINKGKDCKSSGVNCYPLKRTDHGELPYSPSGERLHFSQAASHSSWEPVVIDKSSTGVASKEDTFDEDPDELDCKDANEYCIFWADLGECERNPFWMKPNCQKSCKSCGAKFINIYSRTPRKGCINTHDLCEFWAFSGECDKNLKWMQATCPLSCHIC